MSLCGACLHSKSCHTEHNGHFMYCPSCMKLCDKDDFNLEHQPSDFAVVAKIAFADSEKKPYVSSELKK